MDALNDATKTLDTLDPTTSSNSGSNTGSVSETISKGTYFPSLDCLCTYAPLRSCQSTPSPPSTYPTPHSASNTTTRRRIPSIRRDRREHLKHKLPQRLNHPKHPPQLRNSQKQQVPLYRNALSSRREQRADLGVSQGQA